MAVKTSWSSGDVLTAADLTDTFAAKGDVAGETWTGTHDFSGATVTGIVGLPLVGSADPSAVSSVSIDSCFTSDYANYLISFWLETSTGTDLRMRLRASGADATGGNYEYAGTRTTTAAAIAGSGGAGATFFSVISATGAAATASNAGLLAAERPQASARTILSGHGSGYAGGAARFTAETFGGQYNATTQFDGVTFYPGAGTITGLIRIYGLPNS